MYPFKDIELIYFSAIDLKEMNKNKYSKVWENDPSVKILKGYMHDFFYKLI